MLEAPSTPTRLGPYRLVRELGAGAMGTVYLAEDPDEEGPIALKVVHGHFTGRKGFLKRFQREAEAGRRVDHPNVVRTLDCGFHHEDGRPYWVLGMEYVEGRTLRQLLRDLDKVPEGLVREIGEQVAQGLAAIHEAGIVHRDLKPENVLITDDHRVRIMDLGVARHTELSTALTKEGQFAGSLLYAAPEQFRREGEVGPAADLYALGVVLYELISGTNPFRHDEPAAVVNAHLDFVPERLDRRAEDTSAFLSEVVATLLAKQADARFEDATALAEVLEDGEAATWWQAREAAVRDEHTRRVRVPVPRETKLYGREDDLALLEHAWAMAKEGEGNTVLLEGEAGIGKSRLVDAFLAEVPGEEARVLYGSYPPSGGSRAISEALLAHFGRADLETSLRPYLTITPSLVPALAAVLANQPPPDGAPALQGDALHAVLVHLMRALAAERPLVWVIEDLHFADADSRRLVLSLARAVEGHRVLLCLTTRPGLSEEELAQFGRLETLRRTSLGRLGARDVVLLLEDAFQSVALAEKLGIRIAKKSDGVPFFVFEMIRGLKEGQFITQLPDGSWIESKIIDEIEVPSAVRDLIAIRLGDLSKEERAILDVGAVQGFEFDPDLIARVLERPRVAVLQDIAEIERRSGVLRAHGRAVRFDHHQIQEVLYEDLIPALREEYHALLARVFAERQGVDREGAAELPGEMAVFLAGHGLRGVDPSEWLPYLERALDHLQSSYQKDQAIALSDRALGEPGLVEGVQRVEILLRRNRFLDLLGRRKAQEAGLAEATAVAARTNDKSALMRAAGALGTFLWTTSRYDEAKDQLERAVAIARETGDRAGEVAATVNLGALFFKLGCYEKARDHYERAVAIARETGDRAGEVPATVNLGQLLMNLGRYEEAKDHWEQGLAIAREIGDRQCEAAAIGSLGNVLNCLGRREEARAHCEQGLAIEREIGNRRGEADSTGSLGTVLLILGRYAEARDRYERHLAIAREIGAREGEARATVHLGQLLMKLGRYAEAGDHFEQGLAIAREIGEQQTEAIAANGLGGLFHHLGRLAEARGYFERYLVIAREIGNRPGEGIALVNLGAVWRALGEPSRARPAYAESLSICREIGAREPEGYALSGLGDVAEEEGEDHVALDLEERALALRRGIDHGGGVASSLLHLAELHLRAKPAAAGEALAEAVHLLRDQQDTRNLAYALALLANLPDGDADAAEAALQDAGEAGSTRETRFYLWKATGKHEHLAEAKRLLDHRVEHAPEYRESMLKNVRLNREILEAWVEYGAVADE